jgi:MATE family multidrug resistance protein
MALYKKILNEATRATWLTLPLIISYLVQASSVFLGILFISHLGRDELAASALGGSIYNTLVVFFIGLISSISVVVAQNYGAKNIAGIKHSISQGFLVALFFSVPLMLILWYAPLVFSLGKQSPHIVALTTAYLYPLIWTIFPLAILNMLEQFLIGLGETKVVLWYSLMEVPLEIVAIYAFIYGKLGMPKCGIAGFGYGLTLVFTLTAIAFFFYIWRSKEYRSFKIFKHFFEFNWPYFFELVKIGLPVGTMYIIELAMFAVVAFMMGRIGEDQLAAYQIAQQYLALSMVIIYATSHSVTAQVGQAFGRKDKKAIELITFVNIALCSFVMLVVGLCYYLFAKSLIGIDVDFNNPALSNLTHFAMLFLIFVGILQIIEGSRVIILGALRGLKDTLIPMFITFIACWLIALPISYFIAFVLNFDGNGLWIGIIAGTLAATIMLLVRFIKLVNKW